MRRFALIRSWVMRDVSTRSIAKCPCRVPIAAFHLAKRLNVKPARGYRLEADTALSTIELVVGTSVLEHFKVPFQNKWLKKLWFSKFFVGFWGDELMSRYDEAKEAQI